MRNGNLEPTSAMIAEASAWLIEFRTGDPNQAERDRFNAWLCTSPQHIQAYFEVAAAWAELPNNDSEGRIDIEGLIAAARANSDSNVAPFRMPRRHGERSREQREPVPRGAEDRSLLEPRRGFPLRWTAIAASVALMLVASLSAYLYSQRGTYTTATGEQRSLTLADGSTLELNAQTTVRIRYNDSERHIDLVRGQALFHVAKNKTRPFTVRTGDTQVRALGTQFDVYRKTAGTTVTVVEGSVSVSGIAAASAAPQPQTGSSTAAAQPRTRPHELPSILLAAGEQVTVPGALPANEAPAVIRGPHKADVEAATAWTQKRLVFEDTPLDEVAEEFNRYNIRPLVVANGDLKRIGVSGLYSSTDPTALLAFLSAQPGIVVTETKTEIRITRK